MLKKINTRKYVSGFTLVEVLITVLIIGLLLLVISIAVSEAKAHGKDSKTKSTMAQMRSSAEEQTTGSSTTNYTTAFASGKIPEMEADIKKNLGIMTANGTEYEIGTTNTDYAVVFPLKSKTGYWCVDSTNFNGVVTGLINTTGPKSCANATRVPSGGGSTPPGTPDLAFNMSPSFLDMTGPVGTTGTLSVSLDEVNNAPTSGAITVRLSALSTGFSYSISNPSWTMGNSGFFTTFTTNNVVSAAGSTSLTITLTKDQSFTGSFPITGQLMSGSGGDTNTGNNGSSVTTVSSTGNSGGGGGGGNTAPVITLTGPNPVSCMTPPNYWDTMLHAEPSFTVTDNEETIPTSAVVISDNYLGLPTNNTIRTYSVTDSGGLSAVPQTRTFTGVCGGGH